MEGLASKKLVGPLALAAVGSLYFLLVVRVTERWWFEDDPGAFLTFREVSNPLRFFLDLHAAREFGSGQGLVPMQMLSNWIDVHLPAPMPLVGYVHSLLVALTALIAVFFVLTRITRDARVAFVGAIAWLLLPSTTATCLYLSTRHYVEGLVFSCVVFCLATRSSPLRTAEWSVLAVSAVAGMLCKEIYAGSVPALLIALGLVRRGRALTIAGLLLGVAYAAYRTATVGAGMKYAMPLLGLSGYLKYLVTSPFTFTGNILAYPLVLGMVWGSVRYLRRGGSVARREFIVFAAVLAATTFVLYPVAYAVVNSYRQPGTWYRGPFLPNTIVLAWICLLIARLAPTERRSLLLGALGASLLPGLLLCLRWWDANMVQEKTEGRFVLDHPERLLFTDDPCWWYFKSLEDWYDVPHARILFAEVPDMPNDVAAVRKYGEVWSYQGGEVRPDPRRASAYLRGITPAFRGHSPATPR